MYNSSFMIFSMFKLLETIHNKKPKSDFKQPINKKAYSYAHPKTVEKCKVIYNWVENGYITHDDIIISVLCMSLFGDKIRPFHLKLNDVKNIRDSFSKKTLVQDRKLIFTIAQELKIKKVGDFFKINSDGKNIAYDLLKDGDVSPIFYLKYYKKTLPNCQENTIFRSDEFIHFEKIINILFKTIKEASYAKV